MNKPLVIGLGNRLRGDDALGPLVVDELQPQYADAVDFMLNPADILTLVNGWEERENVFLVDACYDDNLAAGELVVIEDGLTGDDVALSTVLANLRHPQSTHTLDLKQAIAMSLAMACAPEHLSIYAASAKKFSAGSAPSAAIYAAATQITELIAEQLRTLLQHLIHSNLAVKAMHEQSLITNLIKKIEQIALEQAPRRLQSVTVELGALAHISAAHFREHFQQSTQNTAFANLELVIKCATDINSPTAQDILLQSVDLRED